MTIYLAQSFILFVSILALAPLAIACIAQALRIIERDRRNALANEYPLCAGVDGLATAMQAQAVALPESQGCNGVQKYTGKIMQYGIAKSCTSGETSAKIGTAARISAPFAFLALAAWILKDPSILALASVVTGISKDLVSLEPYNEAKREALYEEIKETCKMHDAMGYVPRYRDSSNGEILYWEDRSGQPGWVLRESNATLLREQFPSYSVEYGFCTVLTFDSLTLDELEELKEIVNGLTQYPCINDFHYSDLQHEYISEYLEEEGKEWDDLTESERDELMGETFT